MLIRVHGRRTLARHAVPGPVRRLLRERVRLIPVVLLALVALASAGIQSSAAAALQATLDANWRGAYDILVTAAGTESELDGLLAPNSLSAGQQAMTLDDLASIRAVPNVDVAAPIGELIVPGLSFSPASVTIPTRAIPEAATAPQAFRVTVTYRTNDGIGSRFVSSATQTVVVDETPKQMPPKPASDTAQLPCTLDSFPVTQNKYPELWDLVCTGFQTVSAPVTTTQDSSVSWGTTDASGSTLVVDLGLPPQASTRITLVDPVAEHELLGKAGDFLAPLEAIPSNSKPGSDAIDVWAKAAQNNFSRDYVEQAEARAASQSGFTNTREYQLTKQLYADNGADFDKEMAPQESTFVPLVISETGAAPLTATVVVEPFGDAPSAKLPKGGFGFPYVLPDGIETGATGSAAALTSEANVEGILNPFASGSTTVPWPGTEPVDLAANLVYKTLMIQHPGSATGAPYEHAVAGKDGVDVTLKSHGFHLPTPNYGSEKPDLLKSEADPTQPGSESVYVEAAALPPTETPSLVVPVGSFSTDAIGKLQSELSYVPLGAYQGVDSTVTAGTNAGATMQPSVSGLGLVGPRTVAIASINSASVWNQDAPVSAVRVRVGGVGGYSADAQEKVIAVAQAISDLGFTTAIVAGSSPTAMTVHVKDYAFGVADAGDKQQVGDLGAVAQQWSEFGAAARADLAISGASLAILGIALGSTALLLGAVQLTSVPRRRAQATVMREIGFTHTRIARWMAAEELPGIAIISVAGAATAALAGFTKLSLLTSAVGVAIVVATSVIALVLGARSPNRSRRLRRRSSRIRGRSVGLFGANQSRIHLLTSSTHFIAVLIVAASAASIAHALLQGRANAGNSLLSQFTIGQSALPQLMLGAIGIAAGVAISVIGRRQDLERRREQWHILRAMGWTTPHLQRAQRIEATTVVVPAVIAGTAATWAGVTLLAIPDPLVIAAVAFAAGALAGTTVLYTKGKAATL